MKFNKKLAVAVSGAVLLMAGQIALADSTTDIVDALVSKGVLTEEEGKLISKGHETKKKAEGTVTFKDGFKMNSGDGKSSASIVGRIQLDSRSFSGNSNGSSANDKFADTFDVRRAYLGAKGTYKKYYEWEVTADFAGLTGADGSAVSGSAANAGKNTTSLDVAYLNVNYWDKKAMFQFGQFKQPYSLEERTSSRFIDFQERSFVNNSSLTPGKERGFMIHGTPITGVNYALAFSTGQGKNTNDVDQREDGKDTILHLDANLAEIMGNKEAILHVGGSYGFGDLPQATLGSQRTEGRGNEFFKTLAGNGTTGMERTRYNLEGVAAYGPVKLQAEYGNAQFEGKYSGGTSFDKEIDAYYVSALWMITGEKYADAFKGGKFDRITPKNDFNPDDFSSLGAWEVSARYSNFDASDIGAKTTNTLSLSSDTANTNKADAYTIGLKWIPQANARFLMNYVHTDFNTPITVSGDKVLSKEKALMFRAQYDF
jgi:phosphate-selective porin OprO/OprP